jgi:hypothetical protein
MTDQDQSKQEVIAYAVLRCPFVRVDSHRCNELCTPVAGFGLCGRRASHQPKHSGKPPRVVFVLPRDKAA